MFFKKRQKKGTAMRQLMETGFQEMSNVLSGMSERMQGAGEEIRSLKQTVMENTTSLHKYDMAIEDMLEALQEQDERENARERMFRELEQSRESLLEMIGISQEQLFLVMDHLENGDAKAPEGTLREAWQNQIRLVKEANSRQLERCGLKEIGCPGEHVDYDLYEIIEAVDTDSKEKALTVARVYAPGLLYGGCVRKKAKAAAYRLCEDRPNEDRPNEDRPNEDRPNEDRPNEGRPNEDRPNEDRPNEDRPNEDRPNEDRPNEDRPNKNREWDLHFR